MSIPRDPDTGLPILEHVEQEILARDEAVRESAGKIREMTKTEGWQLLQEHIFRSINDCKEQLIDCTTDVMMYRLQQQAKAYSNILGYVMQKVAEADRAQPPADK